MPEGGPQSLIASRVSVHFGGLKAVDGVDLSLREREILGLIGPNGAGKTTLVNALTGFQSVTSGDVRMGSARITGWSAQRRARHGLVRSFQAVRLFSALRVIENIEAGALGNGSGRAAAREHASGLLEDFDLSAYAEQRAGVLPHGVARRVGIVRALAASPRFLLLDEPAAGLNEDESDDLGHMLQKIRDEHGCGLCIVDHDMRLILTTCERVQVLASGQTLAIGSPAEVRANETVIAAYLGET